MSNQDIIFDYKQISKKIESVFQENNQKVDDHLIELTAANYILRKQNESINKAQEIVNSSLRYGRIIQNSINASKEEVSNLFSDSFKI